MADKAKINSLSEKPVSNSDWLTELQEKLDNATPEQLEELWNKYNGVDEEEPVSEDLEEASRRYALNNTPWDDCADEMQEVFKAGAQWQKEQNNKR